MIHRIYKVYEYLCAGVIWYRNAPERRSGSFFGDPQTPIIGSRSRARHGLGAFRFFFVYEIIPAYVHSFIMTLQLMFTRPRSINNLIYCEQILTATYFRPLNLLSATSANPEHISRIIHNTIK
jgi:hypothetical protein